MYGGKNIKDNKVHSLILLTMTERNAVMIMSFAISKLNCWKLDFSFPISNTFFYHSPLQRLLTANELKGFEKQVMHVHLIH